MHGCSTRFGAGWYNTRIVMMTNTPTKHWFRKFSRPTRWLCGAFALAAISQLAPDARAALGEDVTSVAADQVRMQAKLQVLPNTTYTVHELRMPSGTTVREFVGESGKVFAVAWFGGWRPNLRDIMGVHYDRYLAGTRGRRATRGPARIELPGMVVIMGGHQRAFFGQVYLLDLLPEGLRPDDIR